MKNLYCKQLCAWLLANQNEKMYAEIEPGKKLNSVMLGSALDAQYVRLCNIPVYLYYIFKYYVSSWELNIDDYLACRLNIKLNFVLLDESQSHRNWFDVYCVNIIIIFVLVDVVLWHQSGHVLCCGNIITNFVLLGFIPLH